MMKRTLSLALMAVVCMGCLDLDGFVYNPVHCSTVNSDSCSGNAWDRVCVPCDEPYDWAQDYPWFEQTLDTGQTVRAIDAGTITNESVTTTDGEGTLDFYSIPAHGDDPELANTTILYNHGNYAGIEHYLPRLRYLHEAGYHIIVWDYRGYGKSLPDTTPTPEQFLADARQIREYAEQHAPDPNKIVVYANSLGGIPSVEMAVHKAPCALFMEAPFTSMHQIAPANSGLSLPEGFLSQGRFNNAEKIRAYQEPLLIMHGELDNKFSPEDIRTLYDNAGSTQKELWILPGVRHGIVNIGVPEAGLTPYFDTMRTFLVDKAPQCIGVP